MEQRIEYKGMTSQPSDYQCGDGEMKVAVNAEYRDGGYHAVRIPNGVQYNYDNFIPLYVHRPNGVGDILVGIIKDKGKYKLHAVLNNNVIEFNDNIEVKNIDDIDNFCSIGNILCFTISKQITTFTYRDNLYYSNNLDIDLNFKIYANLIQETSTIWPYKNDRKYKRTKYTYTFCYPIEDLPGDVYLKKIDGSLDDYTQPADSAFKDDTASNYVFATLNKQIRDNLQYARFVYPRILLYAVKLYSGEYLYCSPRLLIYPIRDAVYFGMITNNLDKPGLFTLDGYQAVRREDYGELKNGYDYNLKNLRIALNKYNIYIDISKDVVDELEKLSKMGIITSIDFFLSNNIVEHKSKYAYALYKKESGADFGYLPMFTKKREKEIVNDIITSPLYKVKTLSIEEFINWGNNNLFDSTDVEKLINIEQQEVFIPQNKTIYNIAADRIINYNNRIIASNITNISPKPYSLKYLCTPIYFNGIYVEDSDYYNNKDNKWFNRSHYAYQQKYDLEHDIGLYAYLENEIKKVTVIVNSANGFIGASIDVSENYIPLLYNYRYSSAFKNGYVIFSNDNNSYAIPIEGNDINLDYAYVDNAKGILEFFKKEYKIPSYRELSYEPNLIKASEVNNPFVFKDGNSASCGAGCVLAIASNSRAVSQGQFGQYPLFAFCTDGVYAIGVGTDGTLQNCSPYSYDVITDSKSVSNMESSVVFVTKQGVIALGGEGRQLLLSADKTADYKYDLGKENHQKKFVEKAVMNVVGLSSPPAMTDLYTYLTTGARIAYDYPHGRLIVYNPNHDYSYVMEAASGMWSVMTQKFHSNLNVYEECLMVKEETEKVNEETTTKYNVYNYSTDNVVENQHAYLITRPFKLGYPDVHKTIQSIIQRGVFCSKNDVQQCMYGSNDLYNWVPVWSSKDIYMRGFMGTGYKYYRMILFIPEFKQDETLQGASVSFEPRMTNKQR